jgi:hypothetical protein
MFKLTGAFAVIAIWVSFIVGWVANIVQVVQLAIADAPVTTLFILKCVGILVAPVGAIFGWFGIFA